MDEGSTPISKSVITSTMGVMLLAAAGCVSALPLDEPITPIPIPAERDTGKINLGRLLFHEVRLSEDNTVSCASCHDLGKAGIDGRRFSIGIRGQLGSVNTPTVLNSGFNFRQFWDGRAEDLEAQAAGPVHNPAEMGSNWPQVEKKLARDPDYPKLFRSLYNDGITGTNIADAIAAFENSLSTPNAPFDLYLRGRESAIGEEAKAGYRLFKKLGCISCHQGINIGGNMFHKFGVFGNYIHDRGEATQADLGRFNVTKQEHHRHVFKVPSLRNVALTAPYFHDGSARTLEDAVDTMARYQLGLTLDENTRRQIVLFLKSLTGDMPVVAN